MKTLKIIPTIAALALLTACGGGESSKSGSTVQREVVGNPDGSSVDGLFLAPFSTMNPHVNGTIPGSATLRKADDRFFAYVRLFAGGSRTWHPQAVYSGGRCPNLGDDANGDGYIDIVEAQNVLGKVIIPLDSDIGTQSSGRNFYPLADLSGNYHYERVTSFRRLHNDLKSEDRTPEDNIMKLGPDEGLAIEGKVVMIQGVADSVMLPDSVATIGRYRKNNMLPIACGVFSKVGDIPGTSDAGQIPGPVAPVEEGQDRPAGEGEGETTGGGTSGSNGGGSNDSDTTDTETTNNGHVDDYGNDD